MIQNPERLSDAELLKAVADQDPGAFSAFYRRHLPRVLAFLIRDTLNPEAAADLAAEVFAAVMLAADRYQPQSDSATPWVIGIARNKLGASRRRGRVEARARRRLGYEALALEDVDLERATQIAETGRNGLLEMVETLPAHERDAVRARIVEERSYSEIASELRCSEMVVRKRVSRGLARVREQLKER